MYSISVIATNALKNKMKRGVKDEQVPRLPFSEKEIVY